tara:strand:+ start:115 stop:522 length:408 start_codon:yes stop_codon:yes gene_type:complete
MRIKCPECETFLDVPNDQINKKGRCLSCGKKFLIRQSILDNLSVNPTESDNFSKKTEGSNEELVESRIKFDLNNTIFALFFSSFGILLGLILGYYIGSSLGGDKYKDLDGIMNSSNNPIIKPNGDTADPFGIDYD